MMKQRHTTLCASAAIAAALMLTPAAGLAQAAPVPEITVPEVTAPPAPPPAAPSPVMTSSPVVQQIPEPDPVVQEAPEEAPPPAARTTTRQATPQRAATVTPVVAPAPEPAAAPQASEPGTTTEIAPVAAIPAAPLEAAPEPAGNNGWNEGLLLAVIGGLAVLALAVWGFVAIGRRKPVERRAVALERPLPKPKPAAATALAEPIVPASAAVDPVHERVTPIGPARPTPAANLSHTGAAVPLPRQIPQTFEEREALIKRMVAARPDRANPFTSPLQRRRRAKLILQSLGRDFGDTEPWIDLSQYPQNWPELAGRKHAAA